MFVAGGSGAVGRSRLSGVTPFSHSLVWTPDRFEEISVAELDDRLELAVAVALEAAAIPRRF